MIVIDGYLVPTTDRYVSQCRHQAERRLERGSRFPVCPRGCRRVGWARKGSLYELRTREWREAEEVRAESDRTGGARPPGADHERGVRREAKGEDGCYRLLAEELIVNWQRCTAVEQHPEKVGGAWVFRGSRVPVAALFANLRDGASVQEFLEWFPGVDPVSVEAVLDFEAKSLSAAALARSESPGASPSA